MRQVPVRTIDQYWKDYVIKGLDMRWGKEKTKEELVKAFREEMFGLIILRTGVEHLNTLPDTESNKRIVKNAFTQGLHKWKMLCGRCNKYRETKGMITEDDLTLDISEQTNDQKTEDKAAMEQIEQILESSRA